jgi:hypothetical protein
MTLVKVEHWSYASRTETVPGGSGSEEVVNLLVDALPWYCRLEPQSSGRSGRGVEEIAAGST